MNTRRNNTRKGLLALAMVLMMSLTATAQVFVLDGENQRTPTNSNIGQMEIPEINSGNDHGFAPLGSGTVLLLALGGAYLLRKKVVNLT